MPSWITLVFRLLTMFVAPSLAQAQSKPSAEEARKIGVQAVGYGLPLVVMDLTKRGSTNCYEPRKEN
jgi:hypothetical protein